MGGGLMALLMTWLQIKDIQNIAAQIPYVASGGLLGVALSVMGAVALFAGTKPAAADDRDHRGPRRPGGRPVAVAEVDG